jgi:transcriptional antiterminator NusG
MAEEAKWYVVHTYSGYENTVKASIEKNVQTRHLENLIHTVSIPLETVTEITDNGPKTYERKVFPGYVLVKMVMTDDSWYIINNVRGVTGFVGSGSKPTPLTEDEVLQLGVEKREIVVDYDVGDNVKINDGPLTSFIGVVEALEIDKNKVRVVVSMFGRETPVELELDQVEPVSLAE